LESYRGNIRVDLETIWWNIHTIRDAKRTNWESYRGNIRVDLETIWWNICMIRDADRSVYQLQWAIISPYYQANLITKESTLLE
jgi:hypothetical protein